MTFRPLLSMALTALMLSGCNSFPELQDQVSDRAEGSAYLELQPIDTLLAEREVAQIADDTEQDLLAQGIGLAVRSGRVQAPNLIDSARAQQARAEQAIIEAAIARERLRNAPANDPVAATPEDAGPSAAEELLRRVEELRDRREIEEAPDDVAERIEDARRRLLDDAREGARSDTVCPPNRPDCAAARIRGNGHTAAD